MNQMHTTTAQEHHGPSYAHVVSVPTLVAVFVVLISLTGLTLWCHEPMVRNIIGEAGLVVAMVIATVKAVLVALYFMHLRYDRPFNAIIVTVALGFVCLFISLTLLDTIQYQPELDNWPEQMSAPVK